MSSQLVQYLSPTWEIPIVQQLEEEEPMEDVDEILMVEISQETLSQNTFDDNATQQPQSLPETFANLPVELLPLIFQHLSLAEQIICRAVCQDWKTETERVLKT